MKHSSDVGRGRGILGVTRTILATIVVLIATLIPSSTVPSVGISHADLVVHVGMFTVWTVALCLDSEYLARRPWLTFGVGVAFAFVTEILQLGAPGRAFEWLDIAADSAGVGFGILLATEWRRLRAPAAPMAGHGR